MCSIIEQLNLIPDRDIFVPFHIWFAHYKNDIINIFAIFKEQLHDVQNFDVKKLDTQEMLKKFARFLYNSSSKVLK